MYGTARTVHIGCDLFAPTQIVLGLFVLGSRCLIGIHLIKHELGGIVAALKHVKTHISGLKSRMIVVIARYFFECLHALDRKSVV